MGDKMKKQLEEKYLKQFENIEHQRNVDEEVWHCEADDILTNLLKELGYKDIVDKFNSGHKWYS
jgi:hypothetical protein